MKFDFDENERSAIRIALVQQIEEYEKVVSYQIVEKDKEFWERELDSLKNAFKKINDGETIEEYREIVKNA